MSINNKLKQILKPINACKYTGVEMRVKTPEPFGYDVIILESEVNRCRIVRLQCKIGQNVVSGLLIKKHHLESYYTIDSRYTLESYRKLGLAKSLLTVARMKYNDVRHSEHLTDLGEKAI